jgi:hypothetical protein
MSLQFYRNLLDYPKQNNLHYIDYTKLTKYLGIYY